MKGITYDVIRMLGLAGVLFASWAKAEAPLTEAVGSGGYAVALPSGGKRPPEKIYRTANARGPMPTNDWWSSLAWMPYSERQYPHPLAVMALAAGLRNTELAAINEYWFDVHGTNHHPDYPASVVTMIWGGKGANGTWFSANPEVVHGINWQPIHGGSLYLGQFPGYGKKNYEALVVENQGTDWDQWADIVWMYRALYDPVDAARQLEAGGNALVPEAGNSKANTYHWIETLRTLGQVDSNVTADYPLFAVSQRKQQRTYVVSNLGKQLRSVTFSDGKRISAPPGAFAVVSE